MAHWLPRRMPDAARVVTESLSWFALHRREGRDTNLYDDHAGKRTVVEFICEALLQHPVGETTACSCSESAPHAASSAGRGWQ